ncbi:MAG: DUF4294 domain-containing protein [Bacteroidetes bacterium]|nr:DUF4294 domain-containing protein [Bacteroidota bacterium]
MLQKLLIVLLCGSAILFQKNLTGQQSPPFPETDSIKPIPPLTEIMKRWGPHDTVLVPAIWYRNEIMSYREEDMVWISNLSPAELRKHIEAWNRLRNAVYVTYPYARVAGTTINQINAQLAGVTIKRKRKELIKEREKELRNQFTEPLTNLSVYQGKILMKLINRQTGNNCYEILQEFKGSLNARLYQTVAFFFGGNLKQDWDLAKNRTDRDIESIVREIDGTWYNNPYRR